MKVFLFLVFGAVGLFGQAVRIDPSPITVTGTGGGGGGVGGLPVTPLVLKGNNAGGADIGVPGVDYIFPNFGSAQTVLGPLTAKLLAGIEQADVYGSTTGIRLGMNACSGNCFVSASPNYSTVEAQPWGGASFLSTGEADSTFPNGPRSADPIVAILDQRYGVPQWMFNSSAALDNRHFASPAIVMNSLGAGVGRFAHYGDNLLSIAAVYSGGRNQSESYGDKTNVTPIESFLFKYAETQSQANLLTTTRCFGNGDCVGHMTEVFGYGNLNTQSDEGIEYERYLVGEGAEVFSATLSAVTTAGDGSSVLQTSAQRDNGTQGEGRMLINRTALYNTGYIQQINNTGGTTQFVGSGTNWDGTFGTSTSTTTTAVISDDAGTVNLFPRLSYTVSVVSTSGFTAGHTVCLYDWDYECTLITSVIDGTHFVASKIYHPHPNGATVATGGLTGYGFEMAADELDEDNPNGVRNFADSPYLSGRIVRQVFPVMYNVSGDVITIFQPSGAPAGKFGGYSGRAWSRMGSGGTGAATVAGGIVTGCTVSGGTGYTGQQPPQLVVTGTWATAPTMHVNGTDITGALTACTVDSPGVGVTAVTVTVTPYNPYFLYPATKTTSVYNASTGTVDGTFGTMALIGTWATGSTIEQQHWFWAQNHGQTNTINQYVSSLNSSAVFGLNIFFTGIHGGSDAAAVFRNQTPNCLYISVSGCNNSVLGNGQKSSMNGIEFTGAWKNMIFAQGPPMGSAFGFQSGISYVGCNPSCSTNYFPYLSAHNSVGGDDILGYDQSHEKWELTGGSTGTAGGNAAHTWIWDGNTGNFQSDTYIASPTPSVTAQYSTNGNATTTNNFGVGHVLGSLTLDAFQNTFASNGILGFITAEPNDPSTPTNPDFGWWNNQGYFMRGDWGIGWTFGTSAGTANSGHGTIRTVLQPDSLTGFLKVGTNLGLADAGLYLRYTKWAIASFATVNGLFGCGVSAPLNHGISARINDANSQTLGSTVTGGGSFEMQIVCNGTNWIVSAF